MSELGMAGGERDRRGFLRGVAAAAAAVGVGGLLSGGAWAAPVRWSAGTAVASRAPLPPIGTNIPCSTYAANVPLKVNVLSVLTLDFKGGCEFFVRTSQVSGLDLEIKSFRVEADASPATPDSGTLLALTVTSSTSTPLSRLNVNEQGGMEMVLYVPLTLDAIDKATAETILTVTSGPGAYATFKAAEVREFPPVNLAYSLQEPVKLYGSDGSQAGVLEGFDGVMNHSAVPAA
ncbi:twin-arginine translocation signal domain-containing protein [Streptomyces sp. NPDC051366]|uniref:twin-arginine translocation signal domain-containing protein n=1 Tax=Streptomyces sp. NPDC051366 TaxID=3365652 RepID=UPI0037B14469